MPQERDIRSATKRVACLDDMDVLFDYVAPHAGLMDVRAQVKVLTGFVVALYEVNGLECPLIKERE
jgi:hypothetical protein